MAESHPSFLTRLSVAFAAFWRILSDAEFAAAVARLRAGRADTTPAARAEAPKPTLLQAEPDSALQLLGLLQQEGRFIDFLEEEVTGYSDQEVGAAARVVHEGCRKAVTQHLSIQPVRTETEGTRISLQEGFDSSAIRLTGNVVGHAPFKGVLTHRGWRATEVRLPKVASGHNVAILAPAEVEL